MDCPKCGGELVIDMNEVWSGEAWCSICGNKYKITIEEDDK